MAFPTYDELDQLRSDPNVQTMLSMLSYTEGTLKDGYGTMPYGEGVISDFSAHPNKTVTRSILHRNGQRKPVPTTASGRYQIINRTWNGANKRLNGRLTDFSPKNQDIAALALMAEKGALQNVIKGDFTGAVNKLGGVWASLPSTKYDQGNYEWKDLQNFLDGNVKVPDPMAIYEQQLLGGNVSNAQIQAEAMLSRPAQTPTPRSEADLLQALQGLNQHRPMNYQPPLAPEGYRQGVPASPSTVSTDAINAQIQQPTQPEISQTSFGGFGNLNPIVGDDPLLENDVANYMLNESPEMIAFLEATNLRAQEQERERVLGDLFGGGHLTPGVFDERMTNVIDRLINENEEVY